MNTHDDFSEKLFEAVEIKKQAYDSDETIKLQEEYRNLHSVVDNLVSMLVKKGLIQPDPYKVDNKISDIVMLDESPFLDTERAMVLGKRLSNYESMLDFICNIFKFSVGSITLERIKILLSLNNYIQWNSIAQTSQKPNTRGLAETLQSIRSGSDSLTIDVVNDNISYAARTIAKINGLLKEITDFQKELYKIEIRKTVFEHPSFSYEKASSSPTEAFLIIKRLYPQVMGKRVFYSELVEELAQEEFGPNKEQLREALLKKFEVHEKVVEHKKVETNTKEMLLDAVRSLGSATTILEQIINKIDENSQIVQNERQSFWEKLCAALRQAFNLPAPPIEYNIIIVEPLTQARKPETLKFQEFLDDLNKRKRTFASFSVKKASGYIKMEAQSEQTILDYLSKQLVECNRIILVLTALDEYFKTVQIVSSKQKIKGIKMELTSLKNTLVKTNQRKADYTAFVEEEEQLKKLGISND